MNIVQAERMEQATLSGIWRVLHKVTQLKAQGKEVVDLTVGQPDFPTPDYIKKGGIDAIAQNITTYPPIMGTSKLREAISTVCLKNRGRDYEADEIIITCGVTHGMYVAMGAYLNPTDEIILPNPAYDCYNILPHLFGATIKSYDLLEENHYQIDLKQLDSLITEKTKMIVLISPNNPTGSILSEDSLQGVAKAVRGKNIVVLSDEIYDQISYDGTTPFSITQLDGMKEQCILMNGFSKYYSMTGLRIGYMASTKELLDPLLRLSFLSVICSNSIAMEAAYVAITQEDDSCRNMISQFQKRRDYLYQELNKIPGISCLKPQGAFYLFLNIKETKMSSQEFSDYLLFEHFVATVPGTEFGLAGEGYVRLSFASDMENMKKAVAGIKEAIACLNIEQNKR